MDQDSSDNEGWINTNAKRAAKRERRNRNHEQAVARRQDAAQKLAGNPRASAMGLTAKPPLEPSTSTVLARAKLMTMKGRAKALVKDGKPEEAIEALENAIRRRRATLGRRDSDGYRRHARAIAFLRDRIAEIENAFELE